jgi:glycosyltransferase involved in cell wall biosynthesis
LSYIGKLLKGKIRQIIEITYKMSNTIDSFSNHPLVSIVTPTHNREKYIPETVNSVLAQTYSNIEYIVIDDGSTDNTLEVLEKYKGRLKVESHGNIGQVRTLNKAWKQCNGKYIGYLSSDDILYPEAVEKLVAILENDRSIVCAFPDSSLIDEFSQVVKKNVCHPFDLAETLITQECYIGPGALFRKDAFEKIGGWRTDLRLAPDREFWIRMSSIGRIEMCHTVLAGYRTHPESGVVKEISEDVSLEYLRVLDDYFSDSCIPENIAARKKEAYGYAYLLLARNNFRSGNIWRGIELYGVACSNHPELRGYKTKIRLLRNVVSRPIRRLISFFRAIISFRSND